MRLDARRLRQGWPCLAAALLTLVFSAVLPSAFATNDDFIIRNEARAGAPNPYTGYLLCRLWSALYALAPSLPWYGLTLAAAFALAAALFVAPLRERRFDPSLGALFVPLLLLWAESHARPGYNGASIFLSGAAALLVTAELARERPRRPMLVLGALGFVAGYEMRRMGSVAALVFIAPSLLVHAHRLWRRRPWREAAFVVLLAGGAIAADGLAEGALEDAGYQDYRAFNRLRGSLHGFPILPANADNPRLLAQLGWTTADFEMFAGWIFFDEAKFNATKLRAFHEHARSPERSGAAYTGAVLGLLDVYPRYGVFVALSLALALVALQPRTRGYPIAIVLGAVTSSALLAIYQRFPPRIGEPLFLLAGAAVFHVVWLSERQQGRVVRGLLGVALAVGPTVWLASGTLAVISDTRAARAGLERDIAKLEGLREHPTLVVLPRGLQFTFLAPFREIQPSYTLIRPSWQTFSPHYYAELRALGIQRSGEVLQWMIDRPDVFLVAGRPEAELMLRYLRGTSGRVASVVERGGLERGAQIFQLVGGAH